MCRATKVRGGAIQNAGHWLAEEQPEKLAQELLSFFNENR